MSFIDSSGLLFSGASLEAATMGFNETVADVPQ
jgi:hypothetical protein